MAKDIVLHSYSEAKGFIHERIIYEYMIHRVKHGNLKMNYTVKHGKRNTKIDFVKVEDVKIHNTHFPDVDEIVILNNRSSTKTTRTAEVKFLTSEFDYHKEPRFKKFIENNGCIIVLKHDFIPVGLQDIDIYELDRDDFKSYVRENFDRLLSSQILSRDHDDYKIWLFSQSKNFYKYKRNVETLPASETGIWCPTETLTSFDLAKKDKVIFIKFGGSFQLKQKVHECLKKGEIYSDWFINQLWIGEITLPIKERSEFCQLRNYNPDNPLWHDELTRSKKWPKVFGFKRVSIINCKINCKELYSYFNTLINPLLYEVFCHQVAREITHTDYIKLIEYIATKKFQNEQNNAVICNKSDIKDVLSQIITTSNILQEAKVQLNIIEQNITLH